ncbi:MAG TPA: transcription factor, partial [Candidatus Polarisedimenticolia bacterium]|nr:transcription factor [Candidatus Polarisedimenticolia bacterium]
MRLLEIEESAAGSFDRNPFAIRHHLAEHPLFAPDRLLELSRGPSGDRAEYCAGDVPLYASPGKAPSIRLTLQETIRQIESCGAWVVLKNVELDPEYGALLDRCLDEVGQVCGPARRGSSDRAGFIFISSAKAVTPCHLDPEHNFLLQIRGAKTIHIG